MFEKKDFDFLSEVFSLARAKTVDLDLSNKNGLINLIQFEESLKKKMIETVQSEKNDVEAPLENEEEVKN